MTQADAKSGTGARRCPRSAGFTMIELVVVIVVLAVISGVVLSNRTSLQSGELGARMSDVRGKLRYLQLEAMKNGISSLVLRCDGTDLWAYNSADPSTRLPLPGESSTTVALASKSMTMGSFIIGFDSFGIPYSGSPLTKLASPLSISITTKGQTGALTVAPETGFVP